MLPFLISSTSISLLRGSPLAALNCCDNIGDISVLLDFMTGQEYHYTLLSVLALPVATPAVLAWIFLAHRTDVAVANWISLKGRSFAAFLLLRFMAYLLKRLTLTTITAGMYLMNGNIHFSRFGCLLPTDRWKISFHLLAHLEGKWGSPFLKFFQKSSIWQTSEKISLHLLAHLEVKNRSPFLNFF